MIEKKFGVDFDSRGGALTLSTEEVTDEVSPMSYIYHTRKHPDGWEIGGVIHEDYHIWINDFEAHHPLFGKVWGDFEDVVYADSEEGFRDFYEKHPPHEWDYADI